MRISGIPDASDETTDHTIMKLFDAIDSGIVLLDVDRSHRIGRPRSDNKPRDIIVKFATNRARQKAQHNRAKLRKSGYNHVYINEDLTKSRSGLLFEARKLVKLNKLTGACASDGTILYKNHQGQ